MPKFNNGESAASVRQKINDAIDKVDGVQAISDADITGGTIDNTVIGGVTPAAGTFSSATVNGNITVTGTVDGRDIAADGVKLDTVETNADVTDTANVTAAGAVMDSELTNEAAVKALDQGVATTDSPTFAATTINGNITVTGTVDGRDLAADGTKLDTVETNADVTDTANVTAAGAVMDSELTNEAAVKALDQGVSTTDSPTFAATTINGNITVTGTVDGRDIAADGSKLDGIESGATADQTPAEIKTAYESNLDTNAYTDAEKSKLAGIEAGADVTDVTNVTAAGALMDSELTNITAVKALDQGVATTDSPTFAATTINGNITVTGTVDGRDVAADGTKLDGIEAGADVTDATNVEAAGAVMESDTTTAAMSFVIDEDTMVSNLDTKVPTQQSVKAYVDGRVASSVEYAGGYNAATNTPDLDTSPSGITKGDMYTVTAAGTFFTIGVEIGDVLISEVDNPSVESDWTIVNKNLDAASIKTAYESNADTNAFTDAEQTKLSGIEAGADVTDTANVTAAGALMDSELTNITAVKALDQGVATTDSPTFAGGTFTGNVSFGDNDKAIFGAGSDLQIYHHPTDGSFIVDNGTGNLQIDANDFRVRKPDGSEAMIHANADGAVKLFYDGGATPKLATTSTGVDVTGTVTADGLTVGNNGNSTLKLKSTDGSTTTGHVLGKVEFESSDTSRPAVKSTIKAVVADSFGRDSELYFTTSDSASDDLTRLKIANNGDISFYEDTGTTPKFFWDASAEALGLNKTSSLGTAKLEIRGAGNTNATNSIFVEDSGAAGVFAVRDNGEVFIKDSLGIGTSSPSATIDVNGTIKLDGNYPVGSANVALGGDALSSGSLSGNWNTAVGSDALQANTTGTDNTGLGQGAALSNTTGANNVAVGSIALRLNTTGGNNTALGMQALHSNTTASNNTAVGYQAGYSNTAAGGVFVGYRSGYGNTSGIENTAIGKESQFDTTTGRDNVSVGSTSLYNTTSGSYNTAIGNYALLSNTTASNNTAVGYQAGYSNTTGTRNTFLGYQSGYSFNDTGSGNNYNTFVGYQSGYYVSTGAKNTILGAYNGNQGGLDIRTSSNNIVLSDGDGNPRIHVNSNGDFFIGPTAFSSTQNGFGVARTGWAFFTNSTANGSIFRRNNATAAGDIIVFQNNTGATVGSITTTGSATAYNITSDYRLKENVVELTGATDRIKQIPVHRFNFIADADTTVDGFLAHEVQAIVPEAVVGTKDAVDADGNPVYQGIDQSKLVPLLTAALQEALQKIDALEARITALETK